MKGIEDIIHSNKEAFDSESPSAAHFDKFRGKLDEFHKETNRSFFRRNNILVKIAAVIVIFLVVSSVFYSDPLGNLKFIFSQSVAASDLSPELKEVMNYYNLITNDKLAQIDKIAVSQEESHKIKNMAETQISDIDKNIEELKQELANNPDNQRITDAIILNQKKKAELMNKILVVMNECHIEKSQ